MQKKTVVSFSLLILTLVFGTFSFSEENTLKIGFVNIRQILTQAPQLKTIEKSLQKEFLEQSNNIKQLGEDIDILKLSLKEDKTPFQKKKIEEQVFSKQRQLSRFNRILQEEYGVKRNEVLGDFQTFIVNMIAKVSKEKKLDIVLNNTGVIYINNRIDITEDVLSELSKINK